MRRQFGEISHQATVVIQCTQDKRDMVERNRGADPADNHVYGEPATLDPGVCRIDRGDLVFQVGTSAVPRGNPLNNAPPVTSNLNGLFARKRASDGNPTTERQLNLKLSEGIRFMGLSLGATVPNPDEEEQSKTQITVRTQGTASILNNGDCNLVPGDTLLWDLPSSEERVSAARRTPAGVSPNKVTLQTVPLKAKHMDYDQAIKNVFAASSRAAHRDAMHNVVDRFAYDLKKYTAFVIWMADAENNNKDPSVFEERWNGYLSEHVEAYHPDDVYATTFKRIVGSKATFEALTGACVTGFLRVQSDLERRRIGKVLSYAKPGASVDVLIGAS